MEDEKILIVCYCGVALLWSFYILFRYYKLQKNQDFTSMLKLIFVFLFVLFLIFAALFVHLCYWGSNYFCLADTCGYRIDDLRLCYSGYPQTQKEMNQLGNCDLSITNTSNTYFKALFYYVNQSLKPGKMFIF